MDKNMSHTFDSPDTGPTTAFYQGVEAGRRKERERIIKLIESDYWHNLIPVKQTILATGTYEGFAYTHSDDCPGCKLLALIKGKENEI